MTVWREYTCDRCSKVWEAGDSNRLGAPPKWITVFVPEMPDYHLCPECWHEVEPHIIPERGQ